MRGEQIGTYLLPLMTSVQDADYTPYGGAGTGGYYFRSFASSGRRNLDGYDTPHSMHRVTPRPSFVKYG